MPQPQTCQQSAHPIFQKDEALRWFLSVIRERIKYIYKHLGSSVDNVGILNICHEKNTLKGLKQQTTHCCLSPAFRFLLSLFTKNPNCPQYHVTKEWFGEIWLIPDEARERMRCDFFFFLPDILSSKTTAQ